MANTGPLRACTALSGLQWLGLGEIDVRGRGEAVSACEKTMTMAVMSAGVQVFDFSHQGVGLGRSRERKSVMVLCLREFLLCSGAMNVTSDVTWMSYQRLAI